LTTPENGHFNSLACGKLRDGGADVSGASDEKNFHGASPLM
jgi:hypothetical protein